MIYGAGIYIEWLSDLYVAVFRREIPKDQVLVSICQQPGEVIGLCQSDPETFKLVFQRHKTVKVMALYPQHRVILV